MILGEGLSSRHDQRSADLVAELETLRGDGRAVGRCSSARVESSSAICRTTDSTTCLMLDIVKQVEDWIRRFSPSTIYTHHPGDLNIDHGIAFRAVLTATQTGRADAVGQRRSWRSRCHRRPSGHFNRSRRRFDRTRSSTCPRPSNGRLPRWSATAARRGRPRIRDRRRRFWALAAYRGGDLWCPSLPRRSSSFGAFADGRRRSVSS